MEKMWNEKMRMMNKNARDYIADDLKRMLGLTSDDYPDFIHRLNTAQLVELTKLIRDRFYPEEKRS